MRARRDRFRPTSLRLTQLEDRSVPAVVDNPLPPPPPYVPDSDHGGLNYQPPSSWLGGSDYLTGPQAGDPLTLAQNALATFAPALGLSPGDAANPVLTNAYADTSGSGLFHTYFKQSFNGLEVFNSSIGVHITADGRVLTVNGGFVPGLAAQATGVVPAPVISQDTAVANAAAYFGIAITTAPQLTSTTSSVDYRSVVSEPEASRSPITTRLVYVDTPAGVRPGWEFNLDVPGGKHWYDAVVDAQTGQVTFWSDWVDSYSASYNSLSLPNKDPIAGTRQVNVNPWVRPTASVNASPFGWQDTNGVAGADFTDTRGNNVFAQADLLNVGDQNPFTGVDNGQVSTNRPNAGSGLVFNYPLDLTASPTASTDAAVTQLFYMNNIIHDIHYQYGFTEAAGNFQVRNYTGQGLGGDQVLADALDGGGFNNANFAAPADGMSGRMQMYQFTLSSPFRDGDFANDVVVHEYGHGVSNRLTGGPANANALQNLQSAGMGEGWSDYWALMFTQRTSDQKGAPDSLGDYVVNYPASGFPLRRYPYSFDKNVDPLTFEAYGTSGSVTYNTTNGPQVVARDTEVHATGELWAATLWDMTWLLIDKYGFDKDLSTGYSPVNGPAGAGNKLSLQLVMDALKLQPANPTFVQARDAILAADLALTGGQNRREIWTAFARRGLGTGASASGSNDTSITTSFAVPATLNNPAVIGQTPSARVVGPNAAPTSVTLTFSEPMNPSSFDPATDVQSFTLTSPSGVVDLKSKIAGLGTWSAGNTQLQIDFTLPNGIDPQGAYQMVVGPDIRSADNGIALDQNLDGRAGRPNDTYTARFQYDDVRLTATLSTDPSVRGAILATFSEPIDPASVSTADLQVSQGTVTAATVVSNVPGDVVVRYTVSGVNFAPPFVTLPYGSVTDPFGFPVEEATGQFGGSFSQLVPYGPPGWEAYVGTATGAISTFGEVDTYTVDVDAGQVLSAGIDQLGGLRGIITVLDPTGAVVATASSLNGGTATFTASVPVATGGRYSVQVTGASNSTGTYRVRAFTGVAIEGEYRDPSAFNDSTFQAESLNSVLQAQGGGGSTLLATTVVGNVGMNVLGGDVQDFFSFTPTGRQQVSIGLHRIAGNAPLTLTVLDPFGVPVTGAVTPTNIDQALTFIPARAGQYVIEVSTPFTSLSATGTEYALGLLLGGVMDQEDNNTPAAAGLAAAPKLLTLDTNVRGALDSGDEDWYQFTVAPGPNVTVYVTSLTPGDGPLQPDNFLDPDVVIYSAGTTPVLVAGGTAATDNGAADGKNALLTATLSPGVYYLQVRPSPLTKDSSGNPTPTSGDYVVQLSTAANPGPVNPSPGPVYAPAGTPYTVTEGGSFVLKGSATDPNGNTLTYSWDLNGDGVFGDVIGNDIPVDWATLVNLGIDDGPATYTVRVQVSDADLSKPPPYNPPVVSFPTQLRVLNGNPVGALYAVLPGGGVTTTPAVDEGTTGVQVKLASAGSDTQPATDPSPLDVQTGLHYSFDLNGDGVFDAADAALGGGDGTYAGSLTTATVTLPAALLADGPGTVTIRGKVIDKDGGASVYSVDFTVRNVAPQVDGVTGTLTEGVDSVINPLNPRDPSADDLAKLHYGYDFDLDGNGSYETTFGGTDYASALTSAAFTVPAAFIPEGPGSLGVRIRVYDKDGGSDTKTAVLPVLNAAPTGTLAATPSVTEGSTAVVQLTGVTDPSPVDTAAGFRYAYDFNNDGVFELGGNDYLSSVTASSATVPASFLDDGNDPNAAVPTVRTVRVRVYDQDGGFTDYTAGIRVVNVAPTAALTGSPVTLGSPLVVSLTGQTDPSAADTLAGFTYSFDFNYDPTPGAVNSFTDPGDVQNATSATASFVYATPGAKTVRARITDKDGGFTDVTRTFTVSNVQPSATLTFPAVVPEGGTATVTVNATHPSAATTAAGFRYAYDFDGDGVFDPLFPGDTRAFNSYATASSQATVNVPANLTADGVRPLAVRVRVFEVNGLSADFVAPIQVANVPPTAVLSGPSGPVVVGDKATFTFSSVTDPSAADRAAGFRYSLDLNNDGDFTDDGEVADSTSPTVTAQFRSTGSPVVRGRVTDKDGGFTDILVPVTVQGRVKAVFAAGVDAGNAPLALLYDAAGNVALRTSVFDPSATGGVRVAAADVNGDGVPDLIAGTGPGVVAEVRVVDGATGRLLFAGRPFEGFTGGVFVAAGDMDGDGKAEFAVSPDEGGGPRVIIYSGAGFRQTISFFGIDDPAFRGGARVGMADMNGDGRADLLVSAGFMGGPRVAGFEGSALLGGTARKLFNDFFAFEPGLRNGVYLAGGDVNGDGIADLVVGAGPGGAPRVSVFDGAALRSNQVVTVASFFTGNTESRGGVRVAVADADGDGLADVVTGEADGPTVNIFYGKNLKKGLAGDDTELFPFSTPMNGVFVG